MSEIPASHESKNTRSVLNQTPHVASTMASASARIDNSDIFSNNGEEEASSPNDLAIDYSQGDSLQSGDDESTYQYYEKQINPSLNPSPKGLELANAINMAVIDWARARSPPTSQRFVRRCASSVVELEVEILPETSTEGNTRYVASTMASASRPSKKARIDNSGIFGNNWGEGASSPDDLAIANTKVQELEEQLAIAKQERDEILNGRIDRSRKPVLCDDALLQNIFSFLPNSTFRFLAATNKQFKESYLEVHSGQSNTSHEEAVMSIERARICLEEGKSAGLYLAAAEAGNSDVFRYVMAASSFRPDESICAAAAGKGHLEILRLARSYGCNWDARTCSCAAEGGHLEVLKWARAHDCPWDSGTCGTAAHHGHLEVLQWARANGCEWDSYTCNHAALGGHLEVLQWARANGCKWNRNTCRYAALGGHLEVLQWCRDNGCKWNRKTCRDAAGGGHLEVLQWAHDNGCHWDSETCRRAAEGGHLEVLKWARAHGCPWDGQTCSTAALEGHLEVLQWAIANCCPFDIDECLGYAHREVRPWLETISL